MLDDWGQAFTKALVASGYGLCAYVPDNRFEPIIKAMRAEPSFDLVSVTREEEGVGVAAGAGLAGVGGVLMMQTTGIGNCINALGSLPIAQEIPMLIVLSERGNLGEVVQTQVPLGQALRPILEAIRIPHYTIDSASKVTAAVEGAASLAKASLGPVALILHQQFATKEGM